jgi:hypothetical protein
MSLRKTSIISRGAKMGRDGPLMSTIWKFGVRCLAKHAIRGRVNWLASSLTPNAFFTTEVPHAGHANAPDCRRPILSFEGSHRKLTLDHRRIDESGHLDGACWPMRLAYFLSGRVLRT